MNLDEREIKVLKMFADKFSVRDIEHLERLLIQDNNSNYFWKLSWKIAAWIGGAIITVVTAKDAITSSIKWLFRP